MRAFLCRLAVTACLALTQCGNPRVAGGAGAGNPPLAEVMLDLRANSDAPLAKSVTSVVRNPDGTLTIADSLGAAVTLTGLQARVKSISFPLPDSLTCPEVEDLPCAENERTLAGPFVIDLLTGTSVPDIGRFRIPAGLYRKIDIKLSEPNDTATSQEPDGLIVTGRLGAAGAGGKAFVISLGVEALDFDNPEGLLLSADTVNTVALSLTADAWFKDVALSACVESTAADSTGVARLQGDEFCGGAGARLRNGIEASGDIEAEMHDETLF